MRLSGTAGNNRRRAQVGAACLALLACVSPAGAQIPGLTPPQIAGPFAGRMGAAPGEAVGVLPGMTAGPYGSQAGAFGHLMQGTQAMMPDPSALGMDGLRMSTSSETATPPKRTKGTGGGPDAPDVPESRESFWDVMAGACAGGAFIGGFAVINAAPAAGAVAQAGGAAAAPVAAAAVLSAMGVGCGLGVATAGVSLSAARGWGYLRRRF